MRVLTPAEMRAVDAIAVGEVGIPGVALMESAGARVCEVISSLKHVSPEGLSCLVLAGRGNNGGDGSVVARRLFAAGRRVLLVLAGHPSTLQGDARVFWDAAARSGVPCYIYSEGSLARPFANATQDLHLADEISSVSIIVDALLGTGSADAPRGAVLDLINTVNRARRPGVLQPTVVSVDVPSGIDPQTGGVASEAIEADETVTFCLPKTGMLQFPAARYCGRVWVTGIGIPPVCIDRVGPQQELITPEGVRRLLPVRKEWHHKGTFGHTVVIAGSRRYPGAAYLCAQASMRAGAGLTTLVTPRGAYTACAAKLSEVMVVEACPDEALAHTESPLLHDAITNASALVVGPGMTNSEGPAGFLQWLLTNVRCPGVLDADALNIIASSDCIKQALTVASHNTDMVLTPHPGEAARLLECSVKDIQSDRINACRALAKSYHSTVVLKGARTLVGEPDGKVYLNLSGNQGLASGGTGDVLAGTIGSLLAQGANALAAAISGVYIHGLAADIVCQRHSAPILSAGDVIEALPLAMGSILNKSAALPGFINLSLYGC